MFHGKADLGSTSGDGEAAAKAGPEAKVVQRLTGPGEFIVDEVVAVGDIPSSSSSDDGAGAGVDAAGAGGGAKVVYYMGTTPGKWLEKHLFRVVYEPAAAIDAAPE